MMLYYKLFGLKFGHPWILFPHPTYRTMDLRIPSVFSQHTKEKEYEHESMNLTEQQKAYIAKTEWK